MLKRALIKQFKKVKATMELAKQEVRKEGYKSLETDVVRVCEDIDSLNNKIGSWNITSIKEAKELIKAVDKLMEDIDSIISAADALKLGD